MMETKMIVSWLYDKAARAQDHSYARMLNMTARRLRDLEQAQKWIPVTERLPEKTGSYIVHTDNGAVCTAKYYYDLPTGLRFEKPHWNSSKLAKHITHWMSLPEPPKDERYGKNDG